MINRIHNSFNQLSDAETVKAKTPTRQKSATTTPRWIGAFSLLVSVLLFAGRQPPALEIDAEESAFSVGRIAPTMTEGPLLTVRQMKERMKLPCNYVHDGFYVFDSNEVLNQVYQSLMELDDDVIPVLVECGGHDGITKSLTLKASVCLAMNTLLIEASPSNYNILKQTRGHDFTVNAALCNGESVELIEYHSNSGQTSIASAGTTVKRKRSQTPVTAKCTSIDAELDKLKTTLPEDQRDKLVLEFLVLDVEGHEPYAIDGIQKYRPSKVLMETKMLSETDQDKINNWASQHNLQGQEYGGNDHSYNFHPRIKEKPKHLKSLFYGARSKIPGDTYVTSEASQAYMFYGE
jgi:FkbM family methyltransferase